MNIKILFLLSLAAPVLLAGERDGIDTYHYCDQLILEYSGRTTVRVSLTPTTSKRLNALKIQGEEAAVRLREAAQRARTAALLCAGAIWKFRYLPVLRGVELELQSIFDQLAHVHRELFYLLLPDPSVAFRDDPLLAVSGRLVVRPPRDLPRWAQVRFDDQQIRYVGEFGEKPNLQFGVYLPDEPAVTINTLSQGPLTLTAQEIWDRKGEFDERRERPSFLR